jgi:flagellar basal-body rod protein FlgC
MDVVTLSNDVGDHHLGIRTTLAPREPSYTPAYEPSSPHANEQGLVAAPNVDITKEIVDSMMAEIAYKASAKVIAAEKRNEETLIDTLS